jgi:septal ring factor EnvC (AmiA/AmiB activator)
MADRNIGGNAMSVERLSNAEKNIDKMQSSLHSIELGQVKQSEQINQINQNVSRVERTLDDVNKTLGLMQTSIASINVTLAENTQQLKEHIRRTALLEDRVAPLEKFQWKLIGGGLVASSIGGLIVAFFLK